MVDRTEILELIKSIYLFKKASDEQIEMAVDLFSVWEYEKGEVIFQQGKPAANLFIVFEGQVELIRFDEKGRHPMGVWGRGEVIGFEMLEYDRNNLTTAVAVTPVTLLWLDREKTRKLLLSISTFNLDLKLLYESYQLSLRHRFPWLDKEESVIFVSRRHWFNLLERMSIPVVWTILSISILIYFVVTLPGLLTPLIILAVDILISMAWLVWSYADWANDYSIITNRRLIFQERVILLYHSRQEAPLGTILSVSTETDWIGRQFSFGNVVARTYTGQIVLPKLPHPRQVQVLLEAERDRIRSGLLEEEREELEDLIRERIGLVEPSTDMEEKKVEPQVKSGKLLQWLSRLFRLREHRGEVITYWKHWFILLKRIFLPSLTLLLLFAINVYRLLDAFIFISIPTVFLLTFVMGLTAGVWWLYNFIDWRNDHYVITPDQIIDVYKKPLGLEERRVAPLKNILSIEFERVGIIGLLLNFGTVYINVGETTLTFDNVFNPSEVQRELFNRVAAQNYQEQLRQRIGSQKQVADMIEAYHRVTGIGRDSRYSQRQEED